MSTGLEERGLRSHAFYGQRRDHGDRLRYLAGCRCFKCRRANSDYERERKDARAAGDWNGFVDARRARRHLLALRKAGVGRRSVHAATDVSQTVLSDVSSGRKRRIRARTERLIMAVTPQAAAADGAYVDARKTWRQIRALVDEGFTKKWIAEQIGQQRALQLGRHLVTVRHAANVDRLYRKYMTVEGR